MTSSNAFSFDLWHPDGLLFDESPLLFVDFGQLPLVFTVRGLAYFAPRFKHVGCPIADIDTQEQFQNAYQAWLEVENVLLQEAISCKPYGALQAVLAGDAEAFEAIIKKLEHRKRANLQVVSN